MFVLSPLLEICIIQQSYHLHYLEKTKILIIIAKFYIAITYINSLMIFWVKTTVKKLKALLFVNKKFRDRNGIKE